MMTCDFIDLPRQEHYLNIIVSDTKLALPCWVITPIPSTQSALLTNIEPTIDQNTFEGNFSPVLTPVIRVKNDLSNAVSYAMDQSWLMTGAIGAGLVLSSSLLDKSADNFFASHSQNRWLDSVNNIGNVLVPLVAFSGAAVFALDNDPVRSRTGYAALEAGSAALMVSTGIKYVTGRARPYAALGNNHFEPFAGSAKAGTDGFPSGHTIIVWSVLTPFAEEYDAPWLYGVAALTNLARVGSRNHWISDTVAGSLLGYGIGKVFWESSRAANSKSPKFSIDRQSMTLTWELP